MNQHFFDKLSIQELIVKYAHFTDISAIDSLVELFSPNGLVTSPMGTANGKEELRKHFLNVKERSKGKKHVITNIMVDLNDVSASATSYLTVIDTEKSTNTILTGTFYDKLEKVKDKWLFKERYLGIDSSFASSESLKSERLADKRNKNLVIFGGNPIKRNQVIDFIGKAIPDLNIYGTLSEEMGKEKILEIGAKQVDLILIGGRYNAEQRVRIKNWLQEHNPNIQTTEPGIDYQYSDENIITDIKRIISIK